MRVRVLTSLTSVLFLAALTWAAAAPKPKAAPAKAAPKTPPERVIVSKTDKSKVSGYLLDATPEGLTVQPLGRATGTLIAWKDIEGVNNGLNRDTAVRRWKEKHAAELCPTCKGDQSIPHKECNGVGLIASTIAECAACKGTGLSSDKCTNPKCTEGKVECPNPDCLKLSIGKWVKYEKGPGLWREFRYGNGNIYYLHQGHQGEVVRIENGELKRLGECPVCHATLKVDCPVCHGKAVLPCKTCQGQGKTGKDCPDCDGGRIKCPDCHGSGLKV